MHPEPHFVSISSKAQGEGRYRWRHDKVLIEIAKWIDLQRIKANDHMIPPPRGVVFLKQGEKFPKSRRTDSSEPPILYQTSDNASQP